MEYVNSAKKLSRLTLVPMLHNLDALLSQDCMYGLHKEAEAWISQINVGLVGAWHPSVLSWRLEPAFGSFPLLHSQAPCSISSRGWKTVLSVLPLSNTRPC